MSRYITVCLKIEDPVASKSLWDAHLGGSTIMGCRVTAIALGDVLEFKDKLIEELSKEGDNIEIIDRLDNEFYAEHLKRGAE